MSDEGIIRNAKERTGIVIAIDWENIRRSAMDYGLDLHPTGLCDVLFEVGTLFGDVIGAQVFGDWSLRMDDGSEFQENGVQPFQAPRTIHGKDRTDAVMLLEVWDWIREKEGLGFLLLATGDADFQILVNKCKDVGLRVILAAFSPSFSTDLLSAAPFFPLESEMSEVRLAEHGLVPVLSHARYGTVDRQLADFVVRIDRFSRNVSFVGYGKLCREWMVDWGVGRSERDCFDLMERWQSQGIVETYQVPNPMNPLYPTTAVRLQREHPLVREIMEKGTDAYTDDPRGESPNTQRNSRL